MKKGIFSSKHNTRAVLHFLCILVVTSTLAISLSACYKEKDTLDGYWTTSEVKFSDSRYLNTHSEFKAVLEEQLSKTRFQLNQDGSGISDYVGLVFNITWELGEDGYIKVYLDNGLLYTELYNASKEDSLIMDVQTDDYLAQVVLKKSSEAAVFDDTSEQAVSSVDDPIVSPLMTDYFSLAFSEEWCEKCCYEIEENKFGTEGYTVRFKLNQSYRGDYDGWLFSLCVTDDYSTFYEQYDNYVGLITVGEDKQLYVIAEYPTEVQVESAYNELYDYLRCDIPQILSGIWVTNSNSDFTPATKDVTENQVKENDIPFIAAWTDKLDVSFAPSVGYMDVTNTCLSSDGTASGMGVGTIYGAYAIPNVYYYWLDDGHQYRYYGVQDDVVVAYLDDVSDYNHSVHYYVGEEFDSIPPKTVNVENRCYFEWELMNGYLVLAAFPNAYGSPYTEWLVSKAMYFKSRDMCFWLSPNAEEMWAEQEAKDAALRQQRKEQEEAERKAQAEAEAALKEHVEDEIQRLSEEQFFNFLRIGEKAYSDTTAYSVKVVSADAEHITINVFNDGNYDHVIDCTIELAIGSYYSYPYSLEDVPFILNSSYSDDVSRFYDRFSDYYTTIHATDLSGHYSCSITIRSDSITLDGFDVMPYQLGDYFSLASVFYY